MSARRIITMILSFLFLAAVILCGYTPILPQVAPGSVEAAGPEPTESAPKKMEISLPFVTPKVTLTAGSFPEDTEDLTVQIITGETALLDQFTKLRRADFSGSSCVEEIAAWAAANPQVDVTYTVNFPNGTVVNNRATTLDLSTVDASGAQEAIRMMTALPDLQSVDLGTIGSGFSQADLQTLAQVLPDVDFRYNIQLLGQTLSPDTESLDLSTASAEDIAAALPVLPSMTKLKTLHLGAEGGPITWDTIDALNRACPNVTFDYGFSLWGVNANLADEGINFSHISMNDEGAAVRRILPYMHNCKGVDMDTCGVSHAAMAQIRDENPGMNVVWRVNFGTGYSVRTDVEKILASSPSRGGDLNSDNVQVLKYCTKVKYLDLGHNDDINDISFVSCMPDLEVFIIAINDVSDISPLANCPHLEYLEINSTNVTDLSPLVNCQELVHLNIGRNVNQDENRPVVTDLTPLFSLPKLERVWLGYITAQHVPAEQIEQLRAQIQLNVPDLSSPDTPRVLKYPPVYGVDTEAGTPSEGSWKIVGYTDLSVALFDETGWLQDVLHPRYELLRQQFGYDNVPGCYSLAINDPLY